MLNWINKKRNKKGFTLVELVVVIAILGVLAAIAVPRLTGFRVNAEKNSIESNLRTIDSASTIYEAEKGVIVADVDTLVTDKYLQSNPSKTGITYTIDQTTGRAQVEIDEKTLNSSHAKIQSMNLEDLKKDSTWSGIK